MFCWTVGIVALCVWLIYSEIRYIVLECFRLSDQYTFTIKVWHSTKNYIYTVIHGLPKMTALGQMEQRLALIWQVDLYRQGSAGNGHLPSMIFLWFSFENMEIPSALPDDLESIWIYLRLVPCAFRLMNMIGWKTAPENVCRWTVYLMNMERGIAWWADGRCLNCLCGRCPNCRDLACWISASWLVSGEKTQW